MKTRKILPLVLIVVGAAFLLSSCDAMLDAIYPSNQISVDVAVRGTIGYHPDFALPGRYVQLQLTGSGVNSKRRPPGLHTTASTLTTTSTSRSSRMARIIFTRHMSGACTATRTPRSACPTSALPIPTPRAIRFLS